MSHQQQTNDVSVDAIPVNVETTQTGDVYPADVADEIVSIIRGIAGEQSLTNPVLVLNATRWWHIHCNGGTNPAFQ